MRTSLARTKVALLFVVLFIFLNFIVLNPRTVSQADAAGDGADRVMIKIGEHEIQPPVLNVAPGTTVLWRNTSPNPVQLRFLNGVTTTCKEPRGFGVDVYGIQETSQISGGEFASLCFLEPNDYRYRVEGVEGAYEGTIHVALD